MKPFEYHIVYVLHEIPIYLFTFMVALQRFRGLEDVSEDIAEMQYDLEQQLKEPEWTFRQLLRDKVLRMPLLIVCLLAMAQQLSGINVVSEKNQACVRQIVVNTWPYQCAHQILICTMPDPLMEVIDFTWYLKAKLIPHEMNNPVK